MLAGDENKRWVRTTRRFYLLGDKAPRNRNRAGSMSGHVGESSQNRNRILNQHFQA